MLRELSKKWRWWMALIAMVIIPIAGWIIYRTVHVTPPPEVVVTDFQQEIINNTVLSRLRDLEERAEALTRKVDKEVKGIYAKNKVEIMALPPDDIARGLNDELFRFRSVATSSEGMDSD